MSNLIFDIRKGYLTWNGRSYPASSGTDKLKSLEIGKYRVEVNKVVEGITDKPGFIAPYSNTGWFIPIIPLFDSDRTGLGIHPDGGTSGTAGCVGLRGQAAGMFWKAWLAEKLNRRPGYLNVIDSSKPEKIA